MRKFFEIGGLVAAVVLIVFGAVAITMGVNGRNTVNKSLANEYIVGSPDMTPTAIKAEAQKAGVANSVKEWPTKSVANQKIDTGAKARLMAQYMRVHTLEATRGFTYAQMEEGVDWVLDHIAEGGRAFLHCEHGVGRGPLMTCAVLVAQGYTAPQALRIVRKARWQALPNDRQLAALLDFERTWRTQHSVPA